MCLLAPEVSPEAPRLNRVHDERTFAVDNIVRVYNDAMQCINDEPGTLMKRARARATWIKSTDWRD